MTCKDDYSIAIRPSTETDIIGVQQVFRDGAFSNILPAFKLDLQKKAFHYFVVIAQGVMMAVFQTAVGLSHVILTLVCCLLVLLLFEVAGALMYVYGPHRYLADVNNVSKLKEDYLKNRDTCFWVAEATSRRTHDKEIVGTIAITHKRSLSSSSSSSPGQREYNNSKKIAWLRRMVVKKKFRRMGIAKRLVTTAIEFCRQHRYDQIELITTDIHSAAKRLYERVGFECASHQPHMYFHGYLKVWMYEYVYYCRPWEEKGSGDGDS